MKKKRILFLVLIIFLACLPMVSASLYDAYWSEDEEGWMEINLAADGDVVYACVETSDLDGQTVNFEVWEDDGWWGDDYITTLNSQTIYDDYACASWTVDWVGEGAGGGSGNEFYFEAEVEGKTKSSSNLDVEAPYAETIMACYNKQVPVNSPVVLEALLEEDGWIYNPNLNGEQVNFYIEGNFIGSDNTEAGKAEYNYPSTNVVGTYTIEAVFEKTASYGPSSCTSTLTVKDEGKKDTAIRIDDKTANAGNITKLKATLQPASLYGSDVSFYINYEYVGETYLGTSQVDQNGITYLDHVEFSPGVYKLRVKFTGDNQYNPSEDNAFLTIQGSAGGGQPSKITCTTEGMRTCNSDKTKSLYCAGAENWTETSCTHGCNATTGKCMAEKSLGNCVDSTANIDYKTDRFLPGNCTDKKGIYNDQCTDENHILKYSCNKTGNCTSREEACSHGCTNGICYGSNSITGENVKDMQLYSEKPAFLVSDENWQDVLSFVSVAVWNNKENVPCSQGGIDGKCIYPLLIYHKENENYDAESIIHFLKQYKTNQIFSASDLPSSLTSEVIATAQFISILPSPLQFWKNVAKVIICEDNYQLGLMASVYASYINAPLIFQSRIDYDTIEGMSVITVGNVDKTKIKQYATITEEYDNIRVLQQKYVMATNTDKIILVNPNDIKNEYCENIQFKNINKIYCHDSLAAPVLAAAKEEVIVSTDVEPFSFGISPQYPYPPFRIFADSVGNVYTYASGKNIIDKYDSAGTKSSITLSGEEASLNDMEIDENDNIFAVGYIYMPGYAQRTLFKIDRNGNINKFLIKEIWPYALTVYGDNVYVIGKNLTVFNKNGEKIESCSLPLDAPYSEYSPIFKLIYQNQTVFAFGIGSKDGDNYRIIHSFKDPSITPNKETVCEKGRIFEKLDSKGKISPSSSSALYYAYTEFKDRKSTIYKYKFSSLYDMDSLLDFRAILESSNFEKVIDWNGYIYDFYADKNNNLYLTTQLQNSRTAEIYKLNSHGQIVKKIDSVTISYDGSENCDIRDPQLELTLEAISKKVESQFEVNLLDLGWLRFDYLTVLASPRAIPFARRYYLSAPIVGGYCSSGGNDIRASLDREYADTDGNGIEDINFGRIFGVSVADSSSYIARVLFYENLAQSELKILGIAHSFNDAQSALLKKTAELKTKGIIAKCYVGEEDYKGDFCSVNTFPGNSEYIGKSIISFDDHGSPDSWSNTKYSLSLPDLDLPFGYGFACLNLNYYQSQGGNLFGAQFIRKGGIGYIGSVGVAWGIGGFLMKSSPDLLYGCIEKNPILGKISKCMAEYYYYNVLKIIPQHEDFRFFTLIGDPTVKIKWI